MYERKVNSAHSFLGLKNYKKFILTVLVLILGVMCRGIFDEFKSVGIFKISWTVLEKQGKQNKKNFNSAQKIEKSKLKILNFLTK